MIKFVLALILGLSFTTPLMAAATKECPHGVVADVHEIAKNLETKAKKLEGSELEAVGSMLWELANSRWEADTTQVFIIDLPPQETDQGMKEMVLIIETDGKCVLYFGPMLKSQWRMILERTMAKE